jgi:hypothetical protein
MIYHYLGLSLKNLLKKSFLISIKHGAFLNDCKTKKTLDEKNATEAEKKSFCLLIASIDNCRNDLTTRFKDNIISSMTLTFQFFSFDRATTRNCPYKSLINHQWAILYGCPKTKNLNIWQFLLKAFFLKRLLSETNQCWNNG